MSGGQNSHAALRLLLKSACDTAIEAGALLKRDFLKQRSVRLKGRIDLVTEMDLKSERLIVRRLKKTFPQASFLTEEGSIVEEKSEFKWIIDPLDGTTNYAHTFPFWCVSIALEQMSKTVLGCVYDPLRDELFTASVNDSARLNGRPIRITTRRRLEDSLLATGFPYDIRKSSENNDTAAGVLIVKRAGGKVTDFAGKPFSIYDNRLLATNGKIHNQMMRILKSQWRSPCAPSR
jgi:myo-inositol-1(or 4)-monophosphatase